MSVILIVPNNYLELLLYNMSPKTSHKYMNCRYARVAIHSVSNKMVCNDKVNQREQFLAIFNSQCCPDERLMMDNC